MGEVIGVTPARIILSFSTLWVTVTTFALAYVAGFVLTVAPLMQEGTGFGEVTRGAPWSETPSITIMEIVAIGTDLLLAGGWTSPPFWTVLLFSLTLGFLAAYPVNPALIVAGVKEGMGRDGREHERLTPPGPDASHSSSSLWNRFVVSTSG